MGVNLWQFGHQTPQSEGGLCNGGSLCCGFARDSVKNFRCMLPLEGPERERHSLAFAISDDAYYWLDVPSACQLYTIVARSQQFRTPTLFSE
eukprot:703613-Amphidinium_carterae.1